MMCNSKGSKIKVLLPVFCQSEVISDVQHKCGTQRLGMKSRTELCSEAKLSDYSYSHGGREASLSCRSLEGPQILRNQ